MVSSFQSKVHLKMGMIDRINMVPLLFLFVLASWNIHQHPSVAPHVLVCPPGLGSGSQGRRPSSWSNSQIMHKDKRRLFLSARSPHPAAAAPDIWRRVQQPRAGSARCRHLTSHFRGLEGARWGMVILSVRLKSQKATRGREKKLPRKLHWCVVFVSAVTYSYLRKLWSSIEDPYCLKNISGFCYSKV